VGYYNPANSGYTAVACTVSGTTITYGNPLDFSVNDYAEGGAHDLVAIDSSTVIWTGGNTSTVDVDTAKLTVSGTTLTAGSINAAGLTISTLSNFGTATLLGDGRLVLSIDDGGLAVAVADVSVDPPSWGALQQINTVCVYQPPLLAPAGESSAAVFYTNDSNTSPVADAAETLTISFDGAGTATAGTVVKLDISSYGHQRLAKLLDSLFGVTIRNHTLSSYPYAGVIGADVASNAQRFTGFLQVDGATGDSRPVRLPGGVDGNQSGLTPGEVYNLQADGTLGTNSGTGQRVGRALSSNEILIGG
jgi:hypothetical protein